MAEKNQRIRQLEKKIQDKIHENKALDEELKKLETDISKRTEIRIAAGNKGLQKSSLKDIYTRRRLVDLAKSQSQDITILRGEVEKLRLRTYPAFNAS